MDDIRRVPYGRPALSSGVAHAHHMSPYHHRRLAPRVAGASLGQAGQRACGCGGRSRRRGRICRARCWSGAHSTIQSYPARPDNSGLALGRAALHADANLIGRRLSIPIDIDVFTDGTRRGAAVLAPSELDVIGGVTSTWRVRPGALEIGVRGEQDLPVDWEGSIQSYVDARVRYLYSVAAVRPSFGAALGDGDLSGWFTVGYFAINQTYADRPDLSGLALFRYQAHAELSLWRDIVSFALDANLFTDRRSSDVVAPSELDLTPELILRRAPLEFHVAFESDMPIDRPGAPQSFAYALVSYSFELSGRPPHPLETRARPARALSRLEVDQLDVAKRSAQKPSRYFSKRARRVGREQANAAGSRRQSSIEIPVEDEGSNVCGGGDGAVDDGDVLADSLADGFLDDGPEKWVVRASEQDDVDTSVREGFDVASHDELWHFAFRPAFFGEGNEQRSGVADAIDASRTLRHRPRVRSGCDRPRSGENPDATRAGGFDGRSSAGLDDGEDRDIELDAQSFRCDRAHRVACDDEGLHPASHEVLGAGERVPDDGRSSFRSVGDARGIAQIDDVLAGESFAQRSYDGQTAESGVEDTERGLAVDGSRGRVGHAPARS